jgi:membrane fusion protein, multidrug efflux system
MIVYEGFHKLAPGMKVRVQDPAKLQSEAKKEEE